MLIRIPESVGTLYERIQYPAGELQVRLTMQGIRELFEAKNVQAVCRNAHQHLMELALLSDAIFHIRPYVDSTLILPYLPYGRADRRFTEGDCHGLKTFGEIVNGMRWHRVRTLDVHSFRARAYISNLQDVSARPYIAKAVADICDHGGHPVVLLPDEGAKRYDLDGALQCHKRRDAATGKLSGFEIPSFGNPDVLIVDDICDGGGTFVGMANVLLDRAVETADAWGRKKKLYLYVTHGIFSKGMEPLLKHFEKIYTTDSFKRKLWMWTKWIYWTPPNLEEKVKVFECEPELLGEAKRD